MNILRTPEARFANLKDYPFAPHYLEVAKGLRMHYLDEGPKAATETLLLMHGEPSWSYLYRKMIPVFVAQGYRVIAPDLIGFGKSDKPDSASDYTYARHIQWVQQLIQDLDLKNMTLFGQDWGGLIGLRLVTAEPERFSRIVVANTALPTGDFPMPEAFTKWQQFSQSVPEFPFEKIMQGATVSELSPEALQAYRAPFPDESYTAGARIFPLLVPTKPDDPAAQPNREAWKVLKNWTKPLLTLFSDSDPIMRGGEILFQKLVPGAQGQAHTTIKAAGHFLQEDKGEEIAKYVVEFVKTGEI
ncbi:MAG: haloalkane dehalogenase [Saprospiraceae bacterium]|nr:MAG: haloalkane dehalogenase [Saprospiraceae bacterium]